MTNDEMAEIIEAARRQASTAAEECEHATSSLEFAVGRIERALAKRQSAKASPASTLPIAAPAS